MWFGFELRNVGSPIESMLKSINCHLQANRECPKQIVAVNCNIVHIITRLAKPGLAIKEWEIQEVQNTQLGLANVWATTMVYN